MAVTKITKENISDVSATKLTGALPAIDGQFLSNLPAGEIMVKSAANPTNTANHSAGTMWVNTTTGEMFVCTDATTDANAWTNVGPGETEVTTSYAPAGEQGMTYGYMCGSHTGAGMDPLAAIDKYAFASASNGIANVGTLSTTRNGPNTNHSWTHAFISAGAANNYDTTIETFAFASDGACTNWADMAAHTQYGYGCGSSDKDGGYGYLNGGRRTSGSGPSYTTNKVSRFPFASQSNATNIGTLQMWQDCPGNTVDRVNGYANYHGGHDAGANSTPSYNYRYAFSSSVSSSQFSNMLAGNWHYYGEGSQSATDGFLAGGYEPSTANYTAAQIQQHSFASLSNSALWGSLTHGRYGSACHSSPDHGWSTHGMAGSGWNQNCLDKFSFASAGNSTDVGDMLFQPRCYSPGVHV